MTCDEHPSLCVCTSTENLGLRLTVAHISPTGNALIVQLLFTSFFLFILNTLRTRSFGQLPGLSDVRVSKQNHMQWIAINICCIVISLICSALKHDEQTNFCWPTEQKFKKVKHFKSEIFSHSYRENWMDCLLAGFVCCFWTLWADHCAVNNSTFSNYETTFYLKFILHLRALLNPGFVE